MVPGYFFFLNLKVLGNAIASSFKVAGRGLNCFKVALILELFMTKELANGDYNNTVLNVCRFKCMVRDWWV